MRRLHLTLGLVGVFVFAFTGQIMRHHNPPMGALSPDMHMMYVSRHIYLLGAALVNLALGLYFSPFVSARARIAQQFGSVLLLVSPILLTVAFLQEPAQGLAGRSLRSQFGLYALFGGSVLHTLGFIAEKMQKTAKRA